MMFPLDQIAPFFQKKQTQDAQELINQIKQEVEGGVKMRNDEPKLPEVQIGRASCRERV